MATKKHKKKPASASRNFRATARRRKKAVKIAKKVLVKKKKHRYIKKPLRHKIPFRYKTKAKKKKPKVKIKIRNAEREVAVPFSAESFFRAKIKVVGVGGGGGSIVSEIGRSLEKATFVIADTDVRALKKKKGIKYFCFGQNLTHGLGTGVNVDMARQAAEQDKDKISGIFKEQDIIIFIASLGGGLGSGATKVFAEAAKSFGGITLGIFTMPFKFEGKTKTRIALRALKDLRSSLNVSITIPNERIFKIIDEKTPITQAFSIVNKSLIESLESLIDLIYSPGLINIDFADLKAILKGRGNLAFLNTIESSGRNRAEDIAEKIISNPLYQNNNFKAENILFNISGGQNLSMFEVEKISKDISQLNPSAKIIFGISKDAKLKNKIKATLLMTGPGNKSEAIKEEKIKPVEIKIPVKIPESLPVKFLKENKKPKLKKNKKKVKPVPAISIPIFNKNPEVEVEAASGEKKFNSIAEIADSGKKAIRRNAIEVKKVLEAEEQKRQLQEKEWEIPTFLRRVKFKG